MKRLIIPVCVCAASAMFLLTPLQAQEIKFGQGDKYSDIIRNDHKQIDQLLNKLNQSQDPKEMEDALNQLKDGLAKHMEAEEKYLYPELEKNTDTRSMASKVRDEHSAVKAQLNNIDPKADRETYLGRLQVLSELIKSHVSFEEDQLLPKAEKSVDEMSVTEKFKTVYQ